MNETPERFRNVLAGVLIGSFVAALALLIFKNIPAANEQIIVYMIGQLSGMASTALGVYFVVKAGQENAEAKRADLDAKRVDNTGKLADAMIAVAATSPPSDSGGGINTEERPAGTADDPVHTTDEGKTDA